MNLLAPPVSAPPVPAAGNDIDRKIRAEPGRATGSLSDGSALLAAGDGAVNPLGSPGMRCVTLDAVEHFTLESPEDSEGVTIRAIRPDDRERIVKAFRALDLRSIYTRFFFHKKDLSDEELRRLCEPDRAREVVLVATIGSGSQEPIVGLGHYVRRGASAEIAFTVEEDYQGRGIATSLLQHLAHIARENGILQFEADVLAKNTPMLNVLHHSGLRADVRASDGIVHVTLFLGDAPLHL